MRDFRDAKAMAQTLRDALKLKSVSVTHSESLELIARTFGVHDWNTLAARIQASEPAAISAVRTAFAPAMAIVPMVPLRDVVFFPQMVTPIFVAREKSRHAVKQAMASDRLLFAVTQKSPADDDPDFEAIHRVGVIARIVSQVTLADGTIKLFVTCLERRAMLRLVASEGLAAELAPVEDERSDAPEALALSVQVLNAYQAFANVDITAPLGGTPAMFRLPQAGEPSLLADSVAALIEAPVERKQQWLEQSDVVARLEMLLQLLQAGSKAA